MKAQHNDETKAQVMAALLAGQAVSYVAKEFNIPEGTIYSWKSRMMNGDANPLQDVASEKRNRIGDLVMQLLEAQLITQIAITEVTRTNKWIERQDASGLAVYGGVLNDKSNRLLEMLSKNDDAANDNPPKD